MALLQPLETVGLAHLGLQVAHQKIGRPRLHLHGMQMSLPAKISVIRSSLPIPLVRAACLVGWSEDERFARSGLSVFDELERRLSQGCRYENATKEEPLCLGPETSVHPGWQVVRESPAVDKPRPVNQGSWVLEPFLPESYNKTFPFSGLWRSNLGDFALTFH